VLYHWYEATHAMLSPYRAMADATKLALNNPVNPFAHLPMAKQMAAAAELFERATRRYGKPGFNLPDRARRRRAGGSDRAGGLETALLRSHPFPARPAARPQGRPRRC
jgi:hypothetical protein